VNRRLASQSASAGKKVGISIARKQESLEKEYAGGPQGWTAPKPWQKELAEKRLNDKEQEGTQEERQSEENHCSSPSACTSIPSG
jgi:hypothetical protein